jgi:glucose/arabinose dehydrogenase
MNKKIIVPILLVILAVIGFVAWFNRSTDLKPTDSMIPSGQEMNAEEQSTNQQPVENEQGSQQQPIEQIVVQGLKIPWEIAFLPDGGMLVTERPGTLKRISPTQTTIPIQGVRHVGDGGLLGLAVHPNFSSNGYIYLYLTTQSGSGLTNRVERYVLKGDQLSDRKAIIEGIPGANNHDGGRIAFGPDGNLYVTTGDAEQQSLAQDRNSLAGKILRLKDDGSVPQDNPFNNAVYSYGHRNPQGLAWDNQGRLWATEHGPSGSQTGHDELNLIEKGKNYGWPTIKGDQGKDGMEKPVIHSGANETWAPSGLAFFDGKLFFSGLRGQTLYQAKISGTTVALTAYLRTKYGRLRAVTAGPDGFLYVSTSNTDGRGQAKSGDDKIIKLSKGLFR